jgi:hypothetical protein
MSKTLNLEESYRMYGTMMIDAVKRYLETNVMTVNLYKTVHYVWQKLYCIDANPRYATLVLFLHYNMPGLEDHASTIWDLHCSCTEPFETQTKYKVKTT